MHLLDELRHLTPRNWCSGSKRGKGGGERQNVVFGSSGGGGGREKRAPTSRAYLSLPFADHREKKKEKGEFLSFCWKKKKVGKEKRGSRIRNLFDLASPPLLRGKREEGPPHHLCFDKKKKERRYGRPNGGALSASHPSICAHGVRKGGKKEKGGEEL